MGLRQNIFFFGGGGTRRVEKNNENPGIAIVVAKPPRFHRRGRRSRNTLRGRKREATDIAIRRDGGNNMFVYDFSFFFFLVKTVFSAVDYCYYRRSRCRAREIRKSKKIRKTEDETATGIINWRQRPATTRTQIKTRKTKLLLLLFFIPTVRRKPDGFQISNAVVLMLFNSFSRYVQLSHVYFETGSEEER